MAIFDRFQKKPDEARSISTVTCSAFVRDASAQLEENIPEDIKLYRQDGDVIRAFHRLLETRLKGSVSAFGPRSESPRPSDVHFTISDDRLRAYACLMPPCNGGRELSAAEIISRVKLEGISFGLMEKAITDAVSSKRYLHVFRIATGVAPVDGVNGSVKELFPHIAAPEFEAHGDLPVDFSGEFAKPIRAGTSICSIKPAVRGKDGTDVTGRPIPCRKAVVPDIPQGENTEITADGTSLAASIDGLLYTEDGLFCVHPIKIVELNGDASKHITTGSDLLISGSVSGGAAVEAAGNIIITGEVRDAFIASIGGSIRVQGGINGVTEKTTVIAARQIQSPVISSASVQAGENIYAELVTDSGIVCGSTLNVNGGHGLIVGGNIQVMRRVLCQRIGNLSGKLTEFMLGCSPEIVREWERNKNDLKVTQNTMDMLWENISNIRRQGKLTDEQRELMEKLIEQRDLYEEKRNYLRVERDFLRSELKAAAGGKLICKELFPVVLVRIGDRSAKYIAEEKNCSIHVHESEIRIR